MGSAGSVQSFPNRDTAVSHDTAWKLLTTDINTFVDISVLVTTSDQSTTAVTPRYAAEEPAGLPAGPGSAVSVSSTHTASWGETLAAFSITWTHGRALTTEYNGGLSIFHDVKDHSAVRTGDNTPDRNPDHRADTVRPSLRGIRRRTARLAHLAACSLRRHSQRVVWASRAARIRPTRQSVAFPACPPRRRKRSERTLCTACG
jgi:hypothetical protein